MHYSLAAERRVAGVYAAATPRRATRMIGTTMRNPSIVRHTRWNPVGLIMIAILVLPFALTGKTTDSSWPAWSGWSSPFCFTVVAHPKRSQAAESLRLIRMACSLSAWRRCFTFWWRCRCRCCCSSLPGACAPRLGVA